MPTQTLLIGTPTIRSPFSRHAEIDDTTSASNSGESNRNNSGNTVGIIDKLKIGKAGEIIAYIMSAIALFGFALFLIIKIKSFIKKKKVMHRHISKAKMHHK